VSQNKRWYQTTYFKIFLHLLVWAAFIILPHLLRQNAENQPSRPQRGRSMTLEMVVLFNIVPILFFYFNAHVLMPFYLNRKKLVSYLILLVISIFGFAFLMYYVRSLVMDFPFVFRFPYFSFFNLIFFLAMSIAYRFVVDKNRLDRLRQERETENLKTELSFLRSQVSPHFMFNVLNNIVSLSRTQNHLVEPSLIQLSELMRYMLYESDEEKVTLSREIEYLHNYINLQKMRFGDDVEVDVKTEGHFDEFLIEPMLLIPFVENAFKHGIGMQDKPYIGITIIERNGHLIFEVKNKFDASLIETKDKQAGIGLNNVQRRLKLLYPGKHVLVINAADNWYIIDLKLELK